MRCLWTLLLAGAAALIGALWWLSSYPVEIGPSLRAQLIATVEPALADHGLSLEIDQVHLGLRPGLVPALRAEGARFRRAGGGGVDLSEGELLLERTALLQGKIQPKAIRIDGLTIDVVRAAQGAITLTAGGTPLLDHIASPGALVDRLKSAMAAGPFRALEVFGASNVALRFTDAASGSALSSADADLRLTRGDEGLTISANLGRLGSDDAPGSARIDLTAPASGAATRLRINLRGVVPADLPGLSALGARNDLLDRIRTPLSLELAGALDATGSLGTLEGQISAGAGEVLLSPPLLPVEIVAARAQLRADGTLSRFDLSDLTIDTDRLRLTGRGHVFAEPRPEDATETRLIGQLDLRDVTLDAGRSLPAPVTFDTIATDARLTLDGDRLALDADLRLRSGVEEIRARLATSGPGAVQDPGRRVALDITSQSLHRDGLFRLWPFEVFPRTRRWLDENITEGTLRHLAIAMRRPPGPAELQLSLNFGFNDAQIRFLKSNAPLTGANGRATLENKAFRLQLDGGVVAPSDAAPVSIGPSLVVVPDVTRRPGLLQLDLTMDAPTASFLSVLSRPPFRSDPDAPEILPPQEAGGHTDVTLHAEIPLGEGGGMATASFDIDGTVHDFTNDTLLEGRRLSAERVSIDASHAHIDITAQAELDGLPLDIGFRRDLARAPGGASPPVITARAPLSSALAEAFDITVPPGALSGSGRFETEIRLAEGGPPQLRIDADLTGLGVRLPALGLLKSEAATGALEADVLLSQPPQVTRAQIAFPGLTALGTIDLAEGGGLGQAELDRLDLGGWLRARGRYRIGAGSGGRDRLDITGGSLDLRRSPARPSGGGSRRDPDVSAQLDRVVISDGLALTDLRAELGGTPGARGQLTARVNGRAPFTADLARQRNGLATTLRSQDAGALLAAAGFFSNARGGTMDLRLVPTGAPGTYDGQLTVTGGSLHGAGTAAEILSALSVIGALDQINGAGIVFTEIGARFRLSPDRLTLHSAFAEGPSLGMSLDGTVDLSTRALDLQGAVSPVHFLNRIGGPRRGEGLLGISFRVAGDADTPDVELIPLSLLTPGFMREMFRRPSLPAN